MKFMYQAIQCFLECYCFDANIVFFKLVLHILSNIVVETKIQYTFTFPICSACLLHSNQGFTCASNTGNYRVFSASAAIVRKKGKNQDSPLLKNPGFYVLCCDWIFRFLRLFR